jgi:hypothetical protein
MNSLFDYSDSKEEAALIRQTERIENMKIPPQQILHEGHLIIQIDEENAREVYFILLYDRLIFCENAETKKP